MTRGPHGIELRAVEKRFGDVAALEAVDLEVRPGELMVLVGPSGCGKSTLLRIVAGLEEPTAGEVRIGGRCVNDVAPGDRDVAMVFQSYALYPHMTVAQNLGFGLRVRGSDRAEIAARVEAVADALGIGELLARRPGQLSGGQRQRVALGRAMVRDPGVFLFDEPLSNLDAELRLRTRDEIAALHQRLGTTMVFVTHDQIEALSLGQRVAVMDRGRLHQVGTPDEIYRRPRNLFVAGFVGSPPINRLGLTLGRDGRIEGGPFRLDGDMPFGDRPLDEGTLAVRPEDLAVEVVNDSVGESEGSLAAFSATVVRVEALGSEQRVHLDGPDHEGWVARVPPSLKVVAGDRVDVTVDWERSHLFGPDGNRVDAVPRPVSAGAA